MATTWIRKYKINLLSISSKIDWQEEQAKDSKLRELIRCFNENTSDLVWSKIKNGPRWIREKRHLYLFDGVLRHGSCQYVVPEHLKYELMKLHHDSPFAAHRAFEPTFYSLTRRYYWNFMPYTVREYCSTCPQCQIHNYSNKHGKAPLELGCYLTLNGNRYIILVPFWHGHEIFWCNAHRPYSCSMKSYANT